MKSEKAESMAPKVDLQGISVLLAEDEEINAEVAAAILAGHGMRVTVVDNGNDAITRFKDGTFDLVLMDVLMPAKNGYQATTEIREFEQQHGAAYTPIIAMTAFVGKGELEECLKCGMDGYTSKPIEWDALINEMALVLAKKKTGNKPQKNQAAEKFKGLDYDKFLSEMCNGNEELANRLINKFINERSLELIDAAAAAVGQCDLPDLRMICHSLIGVSSSMCANSMTDESSELRRLVLNDELDKLSTSIDKLYETHHQISEWWASFS